MTTVIVELTEDEKSFLDAIAQIRKQEARDYAGTIKSLLKPFKPTPHPKNPSGMVLHISLTEEGQKAAQDLLDDLSDNRIMYAGKVFSSDQNLAVLVRPAFQSLAILLEAFKKGKVINPRKLLTSRKDNVTALFPNKNKK